MKVSVKYKSGNNYIETIKDIDVSSYTNYDNSRATVTAGDDENHRTLQLQGTAYELKSLAYGLLQAANKLEK